MNAFPIAIPAGCEGYEDGMTLRDWFAGHIINGMFAGDNLSGSVDAIAERAYLYADAMLDARGG